MSNKKRSMVALASLEDTSDDLLTIILVRLPARSIFRFRCVSKRWNSIISSPFFIRSYSYLVRTRGSCPMVFGLIRNTGSYYVTAVNFNVLSVLVPVPTGKEHKICNLAKPECQFLNSSNGLILCLYQYPQVFSILNPLTNRNISLPKPPRLYSSSSVSLICEENPQALSVKYKVFAIQEIKSNYVTMLTFSSDTGKWNTSILTPTSPCSRGLDTVDWKSPSTANAFIYWLSHNEYIALYDTNVDTGIIQLSEAPCRYWPLNVTIETVRSSGDDALRLCGLYALIQLKVWMLPKGEYNSYKRSSTTIPRTKWILMHDITCGPMFHTILSSRKNKNPNMYFDWEECIILKVPHVVLLPSNDRYYICNFESNSFDEVEYNKIYPGTSKYHQLVPYLEPLCLSSYAL